MTEIRNLTMKNKLDLMRQVPMGSDIIGLIGYAEQSERVGEEMLSWFQNEEFDSVDTAKGAALALVNQARYTSGLWERATERLALAAVAPF
jgi:hypothetical protein